MLVKSISFNVAVTEVLFFADCKPAFYPFAQFQKFEQAALV